jgi:hypothetical protein
VELLICDIGIEARPSVSAVAKHCLGPIVVGSDVGLEPRRRIGARVEARAVSPDVEVRT